MAFKKGQSGNANGRPPGSRNKKDVVLETLTSKAITAGMLPLEFFLTVMRDRKNDIYTRLDAAKAAAPYVHKRMPQDVAVEAKVNHTHRGGVMVVPPTEKHDSWEKRAAKAQEELKNQVKH